MLPLDLTSHFNPWIVNIIYLLIGVGFGFTLEVAGFGDSRRLAAQFYFKNLTVLKVMFTAIVVACLLIFLSSSLGLLDFSQIIVNQTFIGSGIVGGLIMGVGFVIGGYCPGTSAVSAVSLKIDGILFLAGTLIGVGLFGETVSWMYDFWNSGYTERLLVSEWLGWSIGATVLAITCLAIGMFYFSEIAEELSNFKKISWGISNKRNVFAAGGLILAALLIWFLGQPNPARRWELLGHQYQNLLTSRDAFIHPLEYIKAWNDPNIKLVTLDFRKKEDFDQFHLDASIPLSSPDLTDSELLKDLGQLPAQAVVLIVATDEQESVQAWKWIKMQGISNLYILDKGISGYLEFFKNLKVDHHPWDPAHPDIEILEQFSKDSFTPKIKLKTTKKAAGLCS